MKYFKIFALFFIFLSNYSDLACVPTDIIPLSEIKPGMKGRCLTIFKGTQSEEFGIEILEIMNNFSPHRAILLVRLVGPKVEETGVVSGMSGSPVYIDNRLAGALCYRFGIFSKEPIGGVMPIEQMFEIFEKEKHRDAERLSQFNSIIFPYQVALRFQDDDPGSFLMNWTKDNVLVYHSTQFLTPIKTPLTFSGFHSRSIEKFSSFFEKYGFEVVVGSSSADSAVGSGTPKLMPGDAVSGVLMDGDLSISATGTVTYCDGNKVLAFGHPLLGFGPVNMPMAHSKILTTLSSHFASFKMPEVTNIIGAFHQDRDTGVFGIVGEKAEMFPVTVNYFSPFSDRQTFRLRVAEDKTLNSITPFFLWIALLNIMESARMGQSDYHTQLQGRISLKDYDDITFNDFYGGSSSFENDVSQSSIEVASKTAAVLSNTYVVPDIESIELNFHSKPGKKLAQIEHVWYDKSELKPGESINLLIFIQPYQGQPIKITKKFEIPKNVKPGRFTLFIGSGQYITRLEQRLAPGKYKPRNFEQLITLLNQIRKNNELFIQLRQPAAGTLLKGQELTSLPPSVLTVMDSKKTSDKFNILRDQLIKEICIPLEWMLSGGKALSIRVKENK